MNALIGHAGFVGATLLRQQAFEKLYGSSNIQTIDGNTFDLLVCAAPSAKKWIANREPEADRRNIEGLIAHLRTVHCKTFVLIGTVDVFGNPLGVNEDTPIDEAGLQPYGLHRRMLEKFVEAHFPNHLIVRLAGVVGPGLRKNAIFDLLNDHNLDAIDSRGIFQFYPMDNLCHDIRIALNAGLKLVHLTAEPVSVAEIAEGGFGRDFTNRCAAAPAVYDFRTRHAALFGGHGAYQYDKRETIQAVRAYAQSEPRTVNVDGGTS